MKNDRRAAALFLLATVPLPTAGLLLSLVFFPGEAWAKAAFALSKVWLVAAPLVWLWAVEKRRPQVPRLSWKGMAAANLTGVVIFAAIGGAWLLIGRERVDAAAMAGLMREAGLANGWLYLAAAACCKEACFEREAQAFGRLWRPGAR